jgi:hypothetical protein
MLMDIKYKHKTYIFYTDEFSRPTMDIDKNLVLAELKLGVLECKDENIRSYIIVYPEYYLWHPYLKEKRITTRIVWEGAYFINIDRNLIKPTDIYECWKDTVQEISNFIRLNALGPMPEAPPMELFQGQIDEFLHSTQNAS